MSRAPYTSRVIIHSDGDSFPGILLTLFTSTAADVLLCLRTLLRCYALPVSLLRFNIRTLLHLYTPSEKKLLRHSFFAIENWQFKVIILYFMRNRGFFCLCA
jgi:hypothetical protein